MTETDALLRRAREVSRWLVGLENSEHVHAALTAQDVLQELESALGMQAGWGSVTEPETR